MSVIIEDETGWGVSFTSHNPEPSYFVQCASYEDAERLHAYLDDQSNRIAMAFNAIKAHRLNTWTELENYGSKFTEGNNNAIDFSLEKLSALMTPNASFSREPERSAGESAGSDS